MKCLKCGLENKEGSTVCTNCGNVLSEETVVEQPAEQQYVVLPTTPEETTPVVEETPVVAEAPVEETQPVAAEAPVVSPEQPVVNNEQVQPIATEKK